MSKNKKILLLKNFPIEKEAKIINNKIIYIKNNDVLFLKSEWKLNSTVGESIVFLTSEVELFDENELKIIIEPYIINNNKNEKIDKYSFKKIKEYTFFYYTIV